MKHYLLLSVIGCLAFSATAQSASPSRERMQINVNPGFHKQELKGEITYKGHTFKIGKPEGLKSQSGLTRADEVPQFGPVPVTEVITDAPGERFNYCKDVIGYGGGLPIQGYGVASHINWDNTDAYFYDIITAAPIGSYVKASMRNANLVVPMNQTVLTYDDEDYVMNLGLMRTLISQSDGNIYIWFEYSDDFDSMSYLIKPNGTMEITSPKATTKLPYDNCIDPSVYDWPDYVLGYYYSDDGQWSGYCDVFQIYDEFNYQLTELPENYKELPVCKMSYINRDKDGVIVTVYDAGDALYIQDMSPMAPGAVFKADVIDEGKRLSVAPNQYIGLEADLYYIITSTAYQDSRFMDVVPDTPSYFLLTRKEDGSIQSIEADPSTEFFLAFNDDPFFFYDLDSFQGVKLTRQDTFPGVPSTPYEAFYEDYAEIMGANWIFFFLSQFANNGDVIDTQNLYYTIYLNGDPYEFEQSMGPNLKGEEKTMYLGLTEPTELIPYNFSNGTDILKDIYGMYYVAFYVEGIETVGIQAVYFWDGVETRSKIEEVSVGDSVEAIQLSSPVSTEYYDLQGRKIAKPGKGLYIRKTQMSDGSCQADKVIF